MTVRISLAWPFVALAALLVTAPGCVGRQCADEVGCRCSPEGDLFCTTDRSQTLECTGGTWRLEAEGCPSCDVPWPGCPCDTAREVSCLTTVGVRCEYSFDRGRLEWTEMYHLCEEPRRDGGPQERDGSWDPIDAGAMDAGGALDSGSPPSP